ncbi:MAG: PEP-CTERM sorting domain-containing protein [Phycisphaeraceae bacterium]|nr:MAG: PEP-CTERM sorting domain-containing protein [Phycisphaeraceae bacterium]
MSRLQTLGLACGVAIGMCGSAQAGYTLLDNFNGYATGQTTVVTGNTWHAEFSNPDGTNHTGNSNIIDGGNGGNALQAKGGAAWRGAERDLTGTDAAVLVNETQTFFWQVKVDYYGDTGIGDWVYDFMMGLSPSVDNIDTNNAWQDFSVMPYINNAPNSPYINANGPGTFWAPMQRNVWTNVWVVINNDEFDPTFDLYYSTGADAPVLVIQDADWRNFAAGMDLNAIGFMAAGWEFSEYLIDNIYYADGVDLSYPVPSPGTLALIGLSGLVARRRR